MNPIGAVSAVSGISGVSGASSITGVNAVSGASTLNGAGAVDGSSASTQAPGNSFLSSLNDAFSQLNNQLTSADSSVSSFAAGGSNADISTVMLQMEEASLSVKTATDVRDKLLEAYQDIMRTQI
jgi:flagellar hook-basal body complex protein FliE